MAKRIFAGLFLVIVALVAVLGIRTMMYKPAPVAEAEPFVFDTDVDRAVANLSRAVQFETDSTDMFRSDFRDYLNWLAETYPQTHAALELTELRPVTPLFKWEGKNPELQPILLAAHYDVVPIASPDQWTREPYGGEVDDEFVWGRGTLDNKGAMITILTVVEQLLEDGFVPERTIYLSFGGDEETGGRGARAVAKHLNDAGIQLAWALDEGSFVLQDVIPGLAVPVASINLSEKGYVTLQLVATSDGGHSSMPPRDTAVGKLAGAVYRLQQNPVPGGLTGISAEFFDALGRHFTLDKRVIFANRWLFNPVLESILSGAPSTDAMLRTTTAPTMLQGSPKDNILPTRAVATINFRIHPRDTVDSIVAHVREVIEDESIEIVVNREFASPASPVSDSSGPGYVAIEESIREAFGPIATVPGLTIAATDARHYAKAADAAYRINPFQITGDDLTRFHGIDERLSIENFRAGLNFYAALIGRQ